MGDKTIPYYAELTGRERTVWNYSSKCAGRIESA
jgi:hypothetical protein